jgi:hypothetical protein
VSDDEQPVVMIVTEVVGPTLDQLHLSVDIRRMRDGGFVSEPLVFHTEE